MDLRCENVKHAEWHDGVIEFKCRSRFCGHRSGVVVIHRFDALTGKALETLRFAEPPKGGTKKDDAQRHSTSVRTA